MNPPLFSIAIPAYKQSFLKECIESILAQSFQNYEIIIVNDDSPENIDELINPFQKNLESGKLIYKRNSPGFGGRNVTKNWDECLRLAHGDYFICMGDDDRLLPDCLQNYFKMICEYPDCSVLHCRTQIIDEKSNIISLQNASPFLESTYSMIWRRWNGMWTSFIGDYCFRLSTLRKIGGFYWMPYGRYSDYLTVYEATDQDSCVMINDYGFQYRVNQQTLTHKTDNQVDKAEAELMYKKWMKQFLLKKTNDPEKEWFRLSLSKSFDSYFADRFSMIIKDDICYNGVKRFFPWMHTRSNYSLSAKKVFTSFLLGIKKRLLNT